MNERATDKNDSDTSPNRWRKILLNRWLLAGIGLVVLYALLGFLLTPWIIKRYVSKYASENLKRNASVAEVCINPFLFTIEAKDFVLEESDHRPIMGFDRLFVDFQLSSLFRWAWTFADIRIEQPSLYVEIQPNGRLNLADLAESLPKSKNSEPADSQPPRLLVHHTQVVGASFTFSDISDTTHAQETFWPLNFEFKEISTIPEQKGPYTVKADLPGGGTVGWQGEISLHPIFSEGKLTMTGFKLATAWKFAQDELNLAEPSGEMNLSTRYRFDYREKEALLVLEDAAFALNGLLLTEKHKNTPLLALKSIKAENMRFNLKTRELSIPIILVQNGEVAASVDEKGVLDWQKLVARREPKEHTASNAGTLTPENQPWRLKAEKVKVNNIAVSYSDQSRVNPIAIDVGGINVLMSVSAEAATETIKALVDDLDVVLNRVSISEVGNDTPFLSLNSLFLNDGKIDTQRRMVKIVKAGINGGDTSVVRGKDGQIHLIEMLNPKDKGKLKRDIAKTAIKAREEGNPWSFRLDTFEMNGFQVTLQDNTIAPAVVYNLKDIRTSLKNLTNDKKTPIDFKTDLKVVQGGRVDVNGQVSQIGDRADARVKITTFNLKPLHPALSKFSSLMLESGNISASAKVNYRSVKSGPQLRADGSVSVNDLILNEEDTGERFLEWKQMSVNGLKFALSPDRLQIEEIKLVEPGAKVVIFKDRSINLAKVIKRPSETDTKTAGKNEQAPIVVAQKDRAPFPVSIERIRVEKGVVDFADFSLILPFASHVTDFSGGATGISSNPTSRTKIQLEGNVDEYGYTMVKGGLSPFAPKTYTDIAVSFQNVEMKPLSPYSATFAGRKIASGTLNLELEYKIKDSELLGDNKVVLEQFTLGERVEAPKAIHLPLDLAIALLTDTEGKIDVAMPVSGNVDNPKFSYGTVIRQAIVNLITKVVTAPFRALGSLFGDESEQVDAISFQPGKARILPPELKKLKNVIEALKKRPQLKLVVHGRFDPEMDGKALRTERVKRALAQEMGVKLSPKEAPGPVSFNTAKTQKSLEKLLKKRAGDRAVDDFKLKYEKKTGQKAKRVKPYLAFFGWESSDTVFYQAIFDQLVKLEPLSENDLQDLAKQRAEAIVKEIITISGFDTERVDTTPPAPVEKASENIVNTSLTLDVVKPST